MEDMSLLEALNTVLSQRRLVLGVPLLFIVIAVAVTALEPRTYTSEAAFIVHARQSSPVSGIAAQLGITISPSDPNQSADFYADLITSREVLDSAVRATYTFGARRAQLVDLFHAKGESAALRTDDAIKILQKGITVDLNHRTGLITVQVRTRWPEVSEQVVARLLTIINDFNLGMRRSQASEERAFVDQRLADAATALRAAENRQQAFQQANRTYRDSPELSFEQERLSRDVSLKQQLYTTLAQASEQARLDELRDTPFVAAVERPTIPLRPTPRPWIKRVAIALFVGLVISVVVAFVRRAAGRLSAKEDPQFRTLQQMLRFRA